MMVVLKRARHKVRNGLYIENGGVFDGLLSVSLPVARLGGKSFLLVWRMLPEEQLYFTMNFLPS
jgi:hypothetical protein